MRKQRSINEVGDYALLQGGSQVFLWCSEILNGVFVHLWHLTLTIEK